MVESIFTKEVAYSYAVLLGLTVVGMATDKIPIHLNIMLHSMLIICIGSHKSLEEMIR